MKKVLASSFAILTFTAALIALSSKDSDKVISKESDIKQELKICDYSNSPVDCVKALWSASFKNSNISNFYSAIDEYSRNSPTFTVYCHDAGHKAGRIAEADGTSVTDIIDNYSTPTGACNNGFLHGALDSFGNKKPKINEYIEVVRACESATGLIRSACSDGIGHSSWLASDNNIVKSTEICLVFQKNYDRAVCLAGAIMQSLRFNPITNREPFISYEEGFTEIPKMCESARTAGAPEEAIKLCFSQVSIPILEEVREYTNKVLNGNREASAISKGAELWSKTLEKCYDYGEYSIDCAEQVAAAVTWYVGDDPILRKNFCSRMPEPWLERCNQFRTR